MILHISDQSVTVIENGIYRFELSNYPHITAHELNKIITFLWYEKSHGRQTEIICEDNNVISAINNAAANTNGIENILQLDENKYVYHATDCNATQKILSEGKLLSSTKV